MPAIEFPAEQKDAIVHKIQRYFLDELDQEVGQFDAQFLLDFFSKEMGSYYYNQGLHDAQAVLEKQLETIADAIYEIEQPVTFTR
ncbi:DUF2164 domain-containing protein [Neptunomonas antarctica]|uniref:Uncharacterized conserved protein, DUF2164 family n=1 Tax=Neptunomonas antarctica TaxID=619304 RepID=A0A1N7KAN0_9GAMM|nr:DUF2164 domain-containing protein [Neptunomonas antarctica]SIS58651.1 Uncharacterized conserved protein, DUF2164 family [Neptunomonas antarctica]